MGKIKITGLIDKPDPVAVDGIQQLRAVHVVEESGDRERTVCGIDLVFAAKGHATDARVSCRRCRDVVWQYQQIKLGKG